MVVCDDLDLPVGKLRIRARGSSGGQKGLADVLRCAGSEEVPRMRLGIGRVHRSGTVDYVLSRFDPQERIDMDRNVGKAADAVECWISRGIDAAMNEFNKKDEKDGD
jgi:peptidyl-tRNA hydrolase, PTH1 family